jgi:Zn-dependent protease with chaperone function
MTSSPSIASRALLAVALMIGFYLLALAMAAVLLYLPYAELVYAHRLHIKLAIGCLFGALAILWSVLPRIDRFPPPGPRLTSDKCPRLFGELNQVARAVGQELPVEVYLVHDVNAWVAQRGGVMGIGSRRVMGIGLPLARVLTVSQLRGVLAHEFGHYYGGDTKLGPWVYKTRSAIIRTVQSLAAAKGQGSLLQLPFIWYGKMFLRITHAVSRRQEFVADELAARTVGAKALIEGLRAVHRVAPAFEAYWSNEVAPVLNAGFRPPLMEGFQQFMQVDKVAEAMANLLEEETRRGKTDPYDTHPSLPERIAALEKLPPGQGVEPDPPAVSLLDDVPALEQALLTVLGGAEKADALKRLDWEEVGASVYLPIWTQLVKANRSALGAVTPGSLPKLAADLDTFGQRLVGPGGRAVPPEGRVPFAGGVLGAALTLLLVSQGWRPQALPGAPVALSRGQDRLEPFNVMESLAAGKLTAQAWERHCAELGIRDADLGSVSAAT